MDALFVDFAVAQNKEQGYLLASTISPEPPKTDPARLYNFHRSTNAYSLETDLRYKLQYNPDISPKLPSHEVVAWREVFTAFYKFTGVLLNAEEASNLGNPKEAGWSAVYDGWKDVVNALLRGYQNGSFLAWTIPCLYLSGKYLRIFAIKADDSLASRRDTGLAFGSIQEEDAFGSGGRHEKLEDAARQINRIFSTCISDRYVDTYNQTFDTGPLLQDPKAR
jgi:hypothetical protein